MNRRDECDGVFCYKAYRLFDTGILAELLLLAEFSDRLGVQHSFGVGVLSFLGLGKQGVEKALSITFLQVTTNLLIRLPGTYSRNQKVGNPIASFLKSNV